MYILTFVICFNKLFIPGKGGQDTKLDLAVIRINKGISVLRDKDSAECPSFFRTYRNILKIRIRGADPSCGSHRLIKGGMDPSVFPDKGLQPVCVCGLKLGIGPVFQYIPHKGIFRGKLFQHLCGSGIAGLGLLTAFYTHLFKEDLAQLLRGIDVKFFSCRLINAPF